MRSTCSTAPLVLLGAVALGAISLALPGAAQAIESAQQVPSSDAASVTAWNRWRVRTPAPLAVRGGVVAVELELVDPTSADAGASGWPARLPVMTDTGVPLQATLGVVTTAPSRPAPGWTAPAEDLRIAAPAEFAVDERPQEFIVIALVRVPAGGGEAIDLGRTRVQPRWIEPDPAFPVGAEVTSDTLVVAEGDADAPDARTPAEFWRWVLLAQELERPCAPPPFSGPAALYALHRAELWCAGLHRVRTASPSVAKELRELLTARVQDPSRAAPNDRIAAWIAQPGELSALLGVLLDPQRSSEATTRAALGWIEGRSPLTIWLESDGGGGVTIAAANPLPEERVLRCAWLEAPKEAPVALLIPSHSVARLRVERPAEAEPSVPGQPRGTRIERWRGGLTLRLESEAWRGRLLVGPGIFSVRPPGLGFSTFMPALTLAAAQAQRIEPVATPWRTTASLRRLAARWEIFVECLRPEAIVGDEIEITVGRRGSPPARFTVNETGAVSMSSESPSAGLAAHARVFADRWRVRVELPDGWIPTAELGETERLLTLSIERRPGASQGRQTSALPVPSWRPPAEIDADLGTWVDMPVPQVR